jgi:hypothetical protein
VRSCKTCSQEYCPVQADIYKSIISAYGLVLFFGHEEVKTEVQEVLAKHCTNYKPNEATTND